MLDLKDIAAFCTINRLGSFSAAARALATTQPSISRRVRRLEWELGVTLFDTRGRRSQLTAKGQEFVPYAEELLRMVDRIAVQMTEDAETSGIFRLGATETVAITWLSSFVENMRRTYPKIVLAVDIDLAAVLMTKFRAGVLDAAIITPAMRDENIDCEDLGCFDYAWMASPRLDIPADILSPAELARFPIISLSGASALYQMATKWFRENGAVPNWVNHCSSVSMVTTLTESALGISLLPVSLMGDRIDAGHLRVIEVTPRFPTLRFSLVYGSDNTTPALRAAIRLMRESSTFSFLDDGDC